MLRSLNIWETDKAGNVVLDEQGRRVALKGPRAGQPKTRKEMTQGELRDVDGKFAEQEKSWRIQRARRALQDQMLLTAAEEILGEQT